MAETRRFYCAGQYYEVIMRVREGLPFVPLCIMDLIVKSAIARSQRDHKVTLTHQDWMGNHPHLLCICRDAERLKLFYTELQKKITDSLKRLLGLPHLVLWEGRPTVALISSPEDAIKRISYCYANPSRANLVDTIEEYPGINSWKSYQQCEKDNVEAFHTEIVPWVKQTHIEVLPSRSLSQRQDAFLTEKLRKRASKKGLSHPLTIYPNAWMKVFHITKKEDVAHYNDEIYRELRNKEKAARELRKSEGKTVIGAERLKRQAILKAHTPKRKPGERKVYLFSSCPERRKAYITMMKELCTLCRELYTRYRRGEYVVWPPGIMRPSAPPIASALSYH